VLSRWDRFRVSRSACVFACLLVALLACRVLLHRPVQTPVSLSEGTYLVLRAVDGDTLELANRARVRLIGVDAPETVHPWRPPEPFGREAAAFTRRQVQGRNVRLRFDKHRVDRYGRYLAYVYVEGVLLNEQLILRGLSRAETRFAYDAGMQRRFRAAEQQARRERRGMWGAAWPDGTEC
jgi:micrococcal nuclease